MRLLESVGFTEVDSSLIQPFGRRGDVKQIPFLTFAAIADSLIQLGLATAEEIADLTSELQAFTERSDTVVSLPRIFQVWGRSSRG
jgi:hypothetical protein